MGRGSPVGTAVIESLERLAGAVGPARARDIRVIRDALVDVLPDEPAASYAATEAAERLDVSLPTVHAWLKSEVLHQSSDSRPTRVRLDRDRVDAVATKLRELRRRAPKTRKLRDIAEWLEIDRHREALTGPHVPSKTADLPWKDALNRIWAGGNSKRRRR